MQGRDSLTRRTLHGCIAAIVTLTLIAASAPTPAFASDLDLEPTFADDPIPDIWERADGDDARSGANQSWIWGPAIRSASLEPYIQSPDGVRRVYYFDKARMEITDPGESWDSIWYATSGLLVREMMLGRIQVGHHTSIETRPAAIPVTGDLSNNPLSPTYATLALRSSIGEGNGDRRSPDRTGAPVQEKLHTDGSVQSQITPPVNVSIAYYDGVLGHNIPDVFWGWMTDQAIAWQYLVGHALTDAYWVDTVVGGEEKVVLVQAFERRVLTFTPDNPAEWQVEAGNAGLHYRAWRGLEMPEDPALHALAYSIPYGEIIARSAERNGADAFVVAGVASAASGFDPLANLSGDRVGLMGVPRQLLEQYGIEHVYDPSINVAVAADLLALLYNETGSWDSAIERYFTMQDGIGTFAQVSNSVVTEAMAARDEFRRDYAGKRSPFESARDSGSSAVEVDENGLYLVGIGEAAHYGKEAFPVERMEHILELHASWGNAIDDWDYDPNGYYCVHPEFIPGERLHLTAPTGDTFWCTIADSVATGDLQAWKAKWAIEVNWDLFEAMGVPYQQPIEVRAPVR
jgi:hypothetical protein